MAAGFRRTPALERAIGVTAVGLLLAVLMRRVDLVVLVAPFAFGTALALLRRPAAPDLQIELTTSAAGLLEGDRLRTTTRVVAADSLDLVVATVHHGPELLAEGWPPDRPAVSPPAYAASCVARRPMVLPVPLAAVRWGRATVGPVVVTARAAQGMLAAEPAFVRARYLPVWPLRETFGAVDAMPRAAGLVGPHRSRRPGEGTDIDEVRRFQPGDRLRRINWRVSQRQNALHVTSTVSDRDTDLALCLDSRHELIGKSGSSLDLAVRAAAAIAEHYLRAGDRVGLVDLGQPRRRVPGGAGRPHLIRLLDVLVDARGTRQTDDTVAAYALAALPPGALVVVLSPLVGEEAFSPLTRLARSGHPVVVVDTMPVDAGPAEFGVWTTLAWRVWRLDRENRVGRLGELGVPVVPWRGAGSLDQVLRDVSRAARAPRVLR